MFRARAFSFFFFGVKKQWDYVIVYKLDRFSRNKYEMTIHKHTLKENGAKLLSAMENIPDSHEGVILESLLEGMNQYYAWIRSNGNLLIRWALGTNVKPKRKQVALSTKKAIPKA